MIGRSRAALLVALAVDNFGAGLFLPLSLVYVTEVVGVPLSVAGPAVMVGTAAGLAVPPVAGRLVDRIGPRRVVTIAQLLQAGGALAYLAADGAALVVLAALLLGAGQQCFYSALFALVADVTGDGSKDHAFTVVTMVRGGAFGAGALVVGAVLLAAGPPGLVTAVAVTAGCFVVAAALLTVWLDAPVGRRTPDASPAPPASVLRNPPYLGLIAVTALYAVTTDVFLVGVPVFVLEVLRAPAWLPGAMLALLTAVSAVAGTLVLRLTRGLSRPAAIRLGALLVVAWCSASAAAVLVPPHWRPPYLLGCTLLLAGANLAAAGRANAMAEAAAPRESRGRHLAAFQYAFTAAQVVAPGIVALFSVAVWTPWAVVAVAAVAGTVLIGPVASRLPARALRDGR